MKITQHEDTAAPLTIEADIYINGRAVPEAALVQACHRIIHGSREGRCKAIHELARLIGVGAATS